MVKQPKDVLEGDAGAAEAGAGDGSAGEERPDAPASENAVEDRDEIDGEESRPKPYPEWPTDRFGRQDAAANTLGYFLMRHCRDEALARIPADATDAARAAAIDAVDTALHNVMDLVEGFWPLSSGPMHRVEILMQVRVTDSEHRVIETVPLEGLDLPIGYWKWAKDGDFR